MNKTSIILKFIKKCMMYIMCLIIYGMMYCSVILVIMYLMSLFIFTLLYMVYNILTHTMSVSKRLVRLIKNDLGKIRRNRKDCTSVQE